MEVISNQNNFPARAKKGVMTIGNFDGVHLGHREIFQRVRDEARQDGVYSIVCTFEPHPVLVIAPHKAPYLIQSPAEKIASIGQCGIDILLNLPFTHEFFSQSPKEFIQQVIVNTVNSKSVIVGTDFSFGKDRSGNVETLARFGQEFHYRFTAVEQVKHNGITVSSSQIRKLIREGNVSAARILMGQPYIVRETVIQGDQRGRLLGFPTANLCPKTQILPKPGVYAAFVQLEDGKLHKAATYVGRKPTFNGHGSLVETNLLDGDFDLYGKEIRVLFVDFIRDEQKFASQEQLKSQISLDIFQIKERLDVGIDVRV